MEFTDSSRDDGSCAITEVLNPKPRLLRNRFSHRRQGGPREASSQAPPVETPTPWGPRACPSHSRVPSKPRDSALGLSQRCFQTEKQTWSPAGRHKPHSPERKASSISSDFSPKQIRDLDLLDFPADAARAEAHRPTNCIASILASAARMGAKCSSRTAPRISYRHAMPASSVRWLHPGGKDISTAICGLSPSNDHNNPHLLPPNVAGGPIRAPSAPIAKVCRRDAHKQ